MVEVGSWALSCHFLGLTGLQWLISIGFGVAPLFWRFVLLLLPEKYFKDWGDQRLEKRSIAQILRKSSEALSRRVHPINSLH